MSATAAAPLIPGALQHVRVLDLSRVLAGPWAARTLGDIGAEVIKVERPGVGDDTRTWGPPFVETPAGDPTGESARYMCTNRNKKSITVDFTQPAGQKLVQELARNCDVVIENFKAGGLEQYGLDYASLNALNARLVYCSITGFGQTGPYAHRAGYDFLIQGMGGLMSITGKPDGEPGGGPVMDRAAGAACRSLQPDQYRGRCICRRTGACARPENRDATPPGRHCAAGGQSYPPVRHSGAIPQRTTPAGAAHQCCATNLDFHKNAIDELCKQGVLG